MEEEKFKLLYEIITKLKGEMVILKHRHSPNGEFITEQVVFGKTTGQDRFDYWTAYQNVLISQNNYMGNIAKISLLNDEIIYQDENMVAKTL